MFCPNCGAEDRVDKAYCRSCGLMLDAVSQAIADQFPSVEHAALRRRRQLVGKLGIASLSIAGIIGLMSLIFLAALYKLVLFGPELLFWASAIALAAFLLLGALLTGYSKLFLRLEKSDPQPASLNELPSIRTTGKLIEDRPFEPVPSVTENTTDLLPRRETGRRGQ